jgi:hypothetical protein
MKSLFYFLFGIIVALYAFVILFDICGPIYLDDYYMDKLVTNYSNEWYYTNLSISAIALFFTIVWIYNLGRGTNHEKEPLLTKKEENE